MEVLVRNRVNESLHDMNLTSKPYIGSAFDELELNRMLCQHYNVRIAGVIINKVMHDKYDQTKEYLSKALKQSWGVPLLACIPDRPFLGCPALADLEKLFDTKLLSGQNLRFRHYSVKNQARTHSLYMSCHPR
jgi:BioD-like phosphotransacetylase family protein